MPSENLEHSWISQLKAGDPAAAQKLWEGYYEQLVRYAQKKLRAAPRRAADEEDVALSAINSFCQGAVEGKFPQLSDPDDLWKILVTIAARKALRQSQRADRQKRGGGKVRGESVFAPLDGSSDHWGIDEMAGTAPTPAFAAQLTEEFERLLDRLGDDTLRQVAVLKLEGYTNQEIAAKVDCGLRSVERKLRGIRVLWSRPEDS